MANKVTKFSGGLQVGSLTQIEINTLGLENGTIVYNSDTNKINQMVNGVPEEVSNIDEFTYQLDLDSVKYGTPWKYSVRCASYEQVDPNIYSYQSFYFQNVPNTIFYPLVLQDNDRVLLKNQGVLGQNGIYKFVQGIGQSGNLVKTQDISLDTDFIGAQVWVQETTYSSSMPSIRADGKQIYSCTNDLGEIQALANINFRKLYVDNFGDKMYGDLDMGGLDPANPLELKHKIKNFSELSSESDPLLQDLNFFKTNSETLKFKTTSTSENIPVSLTQQEYTLIPSPTLIKENTITMEKSPDLAIKLTSNDVAGDKVSTIELNPSAPDNLGQAQDGIKLKFDDGILERKIHLSSDGLNILTDTFTVGGSKISMLGTPTADDDAATKLYVDTVAGGGPTEVTILNDQSVPVNVTGFVVDKTLNKAFTADVSVVRNVTASGFNPNYFNGNNVKVNGFLEFSGGTVVFGDFNKGIYVLNSSGIKDSAFDAAIGTGFDGEVTQVFEHDAGGLIVFGAFTTFNGITRNRVCFLTNSGNDDAVKYLSFGTNMNNGSGFDGAVYAAAKYMGGYIAAGQFISFNGIGTSSSYVISISTISPGMNYSYGPVPIPMSFGPLTRIAFNDSNSSFVINDMGYVFLYPSTMGGSPVTVLSSIDTDAFITEVKINSNILYIGGSFSTVKLNPSPFLAKIDLNSPSYDVIPFTNPLTFISGSFSDGITRISFPQSGIILCSGKFTGYLNNSIVGLNFDGSANAAFNSTLPTSITSPISASIQTTGNTVYFATGQILGNMSDSYTYTYSTAQTYVKMLRLDGAYNRQSDVITFTESEYSPIGGIDETGVTLSMDANGQLQYTSSSLPTNTSYLKYKLNLF